MKISLICFSVIICSNLFSQSKDAKWILVSTNEIGEKTFISSTIKSKSNGIIILWSKAVNEKMDSITNFHYQPVNLIAIDCNLHKMKLDSSILYDSANRIIFKNSYNEKWDTVIKGSNGDLIVQKVCMLFNK